MGTQLDTYCNALWREREREGEGGGGGIERERERERGRKREIERRKERCKVCKNGRSIYKYIGMY